MQEITLLDGRTIDIRTAKEMCMLSRGKLPRPGYESLIVENKSERLFLVHDKDGYRLLWSGRS